MTKQQVFTDGILDGAVTGPKLAMPLVVSGHIRQQQIVTPANPPAGWMHLYPKADGKFYSLTSAGLEKPLGADDPLVVNNATVNQALSAGTVRLTGALAGSPFTLKRLAIYEDASNWGYLTYATDAIMRIVHSRTGAGQSLLFGTTTATDGTGTFTETGRLSAAGSFSTTNLVASGTLNVTGTTTLGALTAGAITAASLGASGGISASGRIIATAPNSLLINTTGGSAGGLEIAPSSGAGAAMIAFHRPGAFAAYFGLDTDNNWKVGGWSMGGVSYRILTTNDYSASAAASKLVMRDANGYIFNSYINLTADIAGGTPAYVAGQNGDNYLRWYPKSVLAPPALIALNTSAAIPAGADGWTSNLVGLTATKTGQWIAFSLSNPGAYMAGSRITDVNGTHVGNYSGWFYGMGNVSGNPRAGDIWAGILSVGQSLYVQGARAGSTGNTVWLWMYFIPTATYPGN